MARLWDLTRGGLFLEQSDAWLAGRKSAVVSILGQLVRVVSMYHNPFALQGPGRWRAEHFLLPSLVPSVRSLGELLYRISRVLKSNAGGTCLFVVIEINPSQLSPFVIFRDAKRRLRLTTRAYEKKVAKLCAAHQSCKKDVDIVR